MEDQVKKSGSVQYRARVFYHHTDCGGVVYYANYLKILEEARTIFLEARGVSVAAYVKRGRYFVVSRQEIDYLSPAYYGDMLEVETRLTGVSGVRIDLSYEIRNQSGTLIATARTVLAFIDTAFKPCPIPADLKALLVI
ncbi:MAG: thioesterase family protein [Candidatus Omnitrophica bacterium]|nr:thioesterase family protein [Candidatus Omnitrophota bacterium]MDD5774911.1 thioesterase family protein [Candidatus Omnitrophota bacterium]